MGCRARRDATELVRLARAIGPGGVASAALGRTLPGRGAWLCAGSMPCFDAALRRGVLERALRCPNGTLTTDGATIEALRTDFVRLGSAVRD